MTSQGTRPAAQQRVLTAFGYLLLLVLGALEGLVGSFQYSRGPSPLVAVIFVVVIFLTCLACGWGMGTALAGLLPAVGWIIVSFALATGRSNGSVIFPQGTAAEWYLYGGALGCAAGVFTTVFTRVRHSAGPR